MDETSFELPFIKSFGTEKNKPTLPLDLNSKLLSNSLASINLKSENSTHYSFDESSLDKKSYE